tara:strand:+ start:1414 stop:2124 length:711 start_codon:yes stop_codon:yes gene_type:complete
MLGSKVKSKVTFSKHLDRHPALKGKQSKLPDKIQQKIVLKSMQKKASEKLPRFKMSPRAQRMLIHPGPLVIPGMTGAPTKAIIGRAAGSAAGSARKLRGAGTLTSNFIHPDQVYKLTKKAGHYGEGRMAKIQLNEIQQMADDLLSIIDDSEELHGWVQVKLATIHDRLSSVHSYMMYEHDHPKPFILGKYASAQQTQLHGAVPTPPKKRFRFLLGGAGALQNFKDKQKLQEKNNVV